MVTLKQRDFKWGFDRKMRGDSGKPKGYLGFRNTGMFQTRKCLPHDSTSVVKFGRYNLSEECVFIHLTLYNNDVFNSNLITKNIVLKAE